MPVGAALGADPVAVIEDPAGADALAPVALDAFGVLGVNRAQPAGSAVFLGRLAGDRPPLRRVFHHRAVGRRHPDHLGAALDQRTVALLAALDLRRGGQRRGGGLGGGGRRRGRVEQDEADAEDFPGRVVHREPGRAAGHARLAAVGVFFFGWIGRLGSKERVAGLGDRHALGQDQPDRGLGPGGDLLRPHLGRQPARVARRLGFGAQLAGFGLAGFGAEPGQGSVHPAEAQVRPEQGQASRCLHHQHVHQSGLGGVPLPRHGSLHAHNELPPAAPGAAMGGSFPGVIVPAFPGLSFPQPTNQACHSPAVGAARDADSRIANGPLPCTSRLPGVANAI